MIEEVDPKHFAVPWAERDGEIVHLRAFDGRRDGLICWECKKPVVYRRGVQQRRVAHFAHKAGCRCNGSEMTAAHRIFRNAVARLLQAEGGLPANMVDRLPWQSAGGVIPGEAVPERAIASTPYIADVLFTPAHWPSRPLALEIVVTSGVTREKRVAVHAAGAAMAVLEVERDPHRFEGCGSDEAMLAKAAEEIRRMQFRLVSDVKRVAPSPVERVLVVPTEGNFACKLDKPIELEAEPEKVMAEYGWQPWLDGVAAAHEEFRQTMPHLGPVAQQVVRKRRHLLLGAPGPYGVWAEMCCPACLYERGGGRFPAPRRGVGRQAWHCLKHNRRGAA